MVVACVGGGRDPDAAGLMTVASSRDHGWEGIEVEEVVHQRDDFSLSAAPRHLLVLHLDRPLDVREHRHGRGGKLREGSLTILPAGVPTEWHMDRHGDVRQLHLHLEPLLLRRVAEDVGLHPGRVEILPSVGTRSPEVEHVGLMLLHEMHAGWLGGRLVADSLATLLAVQLLRHHTANPDQPPATHHALSRVALRYVTEYIEEHLAEDVSLADIAAVASISPYHFARLFREAVGVSPHQYVIDRRVERAKLLLTATDWSLAAIAREVGFANGSHLGMHFKRRTGVSPRHFRAH